MPWEQRRNGRYFYKSVRVQGQPRRIYIGRGPAGRAHEILDRMQKRTRDAARRQRHELAAEQAEHNRLWRELMRWLLPLADAAMLLAGWYKHRGQWRKVVQDPKTRQHTVPPDAPDGPEVLRELDSLRARVNAGDVSAKRDLQHFLEDHPEIYRKLGDLSSILMVTTISKLVPNDSTQRAIFIQNLEEWRRELQGPNPSPIVRGLVDAALSAKLAMVKAEQASLTESPTATIASMKAKTLNQAQHRYGTMLKKLDEVRRAEMLQEKVDSRAASSQPFKAKAV